MVLVPVLAIAAYVLSRDAWHMLDEEKLTYEKLSVQVLDGDDRLFSALGGGEERLLMDIDDLPDHVKNAFIAAEDARFYDSSSSSSPISTAARNYPGRWTRPFWRCSWSGSTARIRYWKCT